MAVLEQQLDSFNRFVRECLDRGMTDASLDELYDRWRLAHPTPEERASHVAAIRAALDDMEAGDHGEPADQVLRELREEFGLND